MPQKLFDNVLSASVNYQKGAGRVQMATHVTILIGGKVPVACTMLGGRYTQEQALAEFRKNPARFTKLPGWDIVKGQVA